MEPLNNSLYSDIHYYQPANITDQWLESIFEQISEGEKTNKDGTRPIYIDVDVNKSWHHMDDFLYDYLMKQMKKEIATSFGLFPARLNALFITLYAIIITFGLVTNILMIFAFFKAKGLRTFRNYYIINLAVR